MRKLDEKTPVFYTTSTFATSAKPILEQLKSDAQRLQEFGSCQVMVVGMPNVGKSTLINCLRNTGVFKPKAAYTGAEPGITRKVGTPIKILDDPNQSAVYVLDTPGVFVPYMPDGERMLRLALCGCVKDTIISPVTIADYLLYHINLNTPAIYERWSKPTNDIGHFLDQFAHQTGILGKGGIPNTDQAALNFVHKWRAGEMGSFLLDDLQLELSERKRARHLEKPSFGGKGKWEAKIEADKIAGRSRKERKREEREQT
jgi:ribosome biogenesis GTPase A